MQSEQKGQGQAPLLGEARIIGNRSLRRRLTDEILRGSLSHAYIVEGEYGVGKHSLAKEVCAALACQNRGVGQELLPCGHCRNCNKILGDKSPDVRLIGKHEKASIGVEDVRFLRSDVLLPPNDLSYRFYIIEDAQDLTIQAQNALLLTMEEPPDYVVFLLLCDNSANLLETIKSRAPIWRLCPVETDELASYMERNAAPWRNLNAEEQRELLCMAAGSVGRAINLLDSRTRKPLTEKRRFAAETVALCLCQGRRDTAQSMVQLQGFGTSREDVLSRLTWMQQALRDLILLKKSENVPLLFYADRQEASALCEKTPIALLIQAMQRVEYTKTRIMQNANIRLALSELLLCDDTMVVNADANGL